MSLLVESPTQSLYVQPGNPCYQFRVAASGCERILLICQALFLVIVTLGIALASETIRAHLRGRHLEPLDNTIAQKARLIKQVAQQVREIVALQSRIETLEPKITVSVDGKTRKRLTQAFQSAMAQAKKTHPISIAIKKSVPSLLSKFVFHIRYDCHTKQFAVALREPHHKPLSYTVTPPTQSCATAQTSLAQKEYSPDVLSSSASSDTDPPSPGLTSEEGSSSHRPWLAEIGVPYTISFSSQYNLRPFTLQITPLSADL